MKRLIPMNILVAVAHPDDEVLGMGGTIAKHVANGDRVDICVFTVSYDPLWSDEYRAAVVKEQEAVDKVLGIRLRYHLRFPTCELQGQKRMDLHQAFKGVLNAVNPDRVYCTAMEDFHSDHQEVFKTVLVNTRPIGGKKIEMMSFETPSSTEWGHEPFRPNMWVDISGGFLGKKLEALQQYKQESKKRPHPRCEFSVQELGLLRGEQIGENAAEAFHVVRRFE